VQIHNIVSRGLSANPRGNRDGKFQVAETPGPVRRRQDVIEKPTVYLVPELFKLLGMVEDHTRGAGLSLPEYPNGDQNFQCEDPWLAV
jgi:hypothetical protein